MSMQVKLKHVLYFQLKVYHFLFLRSSFLLNDLFLRLVIQKESAQQKGQCCLGQCN